MTQEDKELLLKDLCARLPYGVIGLYTWKCKEPYSRELIGNLYDELCSSWNSTEDSQFLPYLRPMSSMTEEEGLEFYNLCKDFHDYELFPCYLEDNKGNLEKHLLWYTIKMDLFDWLNAHHFDYRGLIEKGLAIAVTKENNPYED